MEVSRSLHSHLPLALYILKALNSEDVKLLRQVFHKFLTKYTMNFIDSTVTDK